MILEENPKTRTMANACKIAALRNIVIRSSRAEFLCGVHESPVTSHILSERRRRIHPQQPCLGTAGVPPTMRRRAFEIEAVAWLKAVMLFAVEPNLKFAAKNVQELFAFMRVRFAAAAAWFDAKKMRLHSRLSPSEQFHAHAWSRLQ